MPTCKTVLKFNFLNIKLFIVDLFSLQSLNNKGNCKVMCVIPKVCTAERGPIGQRAYHTEIKRRLRSVMYEIVTKDMFM